MNTNIPCKIFASRTMCIFGATDHPLEGVLLIYSLEGKPQFFFVLPVKSSTHVSNILVSAVLI